MDLQTLSVAVGLAVSLIFAESFGLAAGGMIVPGYLALCLHRPECVGATLAAAVVTFGLVRLTSNWAIIYGRRRIALCLVVGFMIGAVIRHLPALAWPAASRENLGPDQGLVIGFIIPGLIALWIDRQGCLETMSTLITSSVVVRLVLILVGVELLT